MIYAVYIIAAWLAGLGWICGANDGVNPACAGDTRGAWIVQHLPTYILARWLYEEPKGAQ